MEIKTKVIIATITSSIITLLWIIGLILADINLFLISMIINIMLIIPVIKYYQDISEFFKTRKGKVIDDERTKVINEKASTPAFATLITINIYVGIAIFTLRNIYPQYIITAYIFFIISIIGLISLIISSAYYKRKYSI